MLNEALHERRINYISIAYRRAGMVKVVKVATVVILFSTPLKPKSIVRLVGVEVVSNPTSIFVFNRLGSMRS